jgi:ActR/RegA family two-component response regulator
MKVGLRKKSILIVDDNEPLRILLRSIAESVGFDVVQASTRQEAFAAIDRRRFEVVLADMRLVENDPLNRDGLGILSFVNQRKEGTHTYLISGYGEWKDAADAGKVNAKILTKHKQGAGALIESEVREALTFEIEQPFSTRHLRGVRAFSGNENSVNWETTAGSTLHPKGLQTMTHVLDELLLTCDPILERPEDNGMTKVVANALGGLYWSRGVGEAVVVVIASGKIPDPLPRAGSWPAELLVDEAARLYHTENKNLIAAIYRASGVDRTSFSVAREYWD